MQPRRAVHTTPDGLAQAIANFLDHPRVLSLECGVQHYAWGDSRFIPELIGRPNRARRPFAELWLGAHPDLPAAADIDGTWVPLDRLVDRASGPILGDAGIAAFGPRLPFLLKVLAAARPLSIQVHPDARQARAGYIRENGRGIPVDDPKRNYRDPNHKPELLVALTDFFALRGFRPLDAIQSTLAQTPELAAASARFDGTNEGLRTLYRHLMRLEQTAVNRLLDPLLARLEQTAARTPFSPDETGYWLLRADRQFSLPGRRDRGLFSILLLNLVHLRPGQALFLPAGELHSYLRGNGIELMASSNNVLRGGLTPKHIDVEELLSVVRFHAAPPAILEPTREATGSRHGAGAPLHYRVPVTEFALERFDLHAGEHLALPPGQVAIALITSGEIGPPDGIGGAGGATAPMRTRGQGLLAPAATGVRLRCRKDASLYVASAPRPG